MISFRIIVLALISLALTVLSPSAHYQANLFANTQTDEDDSDLPDELPTDDSDVPAIVEMEISQSDLSLSDFANTSGETQVDSFAVGSCAVSARADGLSGSIDQLCGLMRLRI